MRGMEFHYTYLAKCLRGVSIAKKTVNFAMFCLTEASLKQDDFWKLQSVSCITQSFEGIGTRATAAAERRIESL